MDPALRLSVVMFGVMLRGPAVMLTDCVADAPCPVIVMLTLPSATPVTVMIAPDDDSDVTTAVATFAFEEATVYVPELPTWLTGIVTVLPAAAVYVPEEMTTGAAVTVTLIVAVRPPWPVTVMTAGEPPVGARPLITTLFDELVLVVTDASPLLDAPEKAFDVLPGCEAVTLAD